MKTLRTISAMMLVGLLAVSACEDDDETPDAGTGGRDGGAGAGGTGGAKLDGGAGMGGAGGGAGGTGGAMAQPRGAANPPVVGVQIDRMGRPAISTALIETFNANATAKGAAKDAYNAAVPATWSTFIPAMRSSLAVLDALDANCGNQLVADQMPPRYTFLATVLADDRLYVNSGSSKCGIYLGLEAELVVPTLPETLKGSCGGRTPNDDVIDRSYSVLAAGVLTGVDDTIASDNVTHDLNTFPWLAAPSN